MCSFVVVDFLSGGQLMLTGSTVLAKDQSTVAQRAETTVDKHSHMSYMSANFPDWFSHYAF